MDISNSVRDVYNYIANDFNNTRHKIWNVIEKFINSLNSGCTVADIGCGNGKNMYLSRKDIKFKGMDFSTEFVKICLSKGLDVIEGNILNIPFNSDYFDNVICIAVVHHLSERNDRIKAIQELLRITKPGGKILIYVWAFNQPENSKRKFKTNDEMVPYKKINGEVYFRYYHLYNKGELEDDIHNAGSNINIVESGYEYGNYYTIIEKNNFV